MKTVYKFDSRHLGEAFMKELVDMGYDNIGDNMFHLPNVKFIMCYEERKDAQTSCDNHRADFFLDREWDKALRNAKHQIRTQEMAENNSNIAYAKNVSITVYSYDIESVIEWLQENDYSYFITDKETEYHG